MRQLSDPRKIYVRQQKGTGLWENREALEKYLKRLKELMEKDDKETKIKKPQV